MQFIDKNHIAKYLGWHETIDALQEMFAGGCVTPTRHHHTMPLPGQQDATLLLMPAWQPGIYTGLKLVNVYPDNSKKGLPTIMGTYLLMDGSTGAPVISMDAGELTARRTVAASALASRYCSREDATNLLIIGSGRLAQYLGFAHAAVRNITEIRVWARNVDKAQKLIRYYKSAGYTASVADDLEKTSAWAHIISSATMSTEPLIHGQWLENGCHIDLIGGFKPTMREIDDEGVSKAKVFVDTREGVLAEAGDLLIPIKNGTFNENDIVAELGELASKKHKGREKDDDITLFKSVGASLEDLAAAILCYENWLKKDS